MAGASVHDALSHGAEPRPEEELYRLLREDPEVFGFFEKTSLDGLWYRTILPVAEEWVSPCFFALLGYDPAEVADIARWHREHIHPDDLMALEALQAAHIANPEVPFDSIVRHRHKAGHTVWVRCRGLAVGDGVVAPLRMLGSHQDVTALKEAEQLALAREARLREMHTAYQAAQEAAIDAMVTFEVSLNGGMPADFIYRQVNPAACRLLHRSREELLNRGLRQVFPGIENTDLFRRFVSAYRLNEPQEFETCYHMDGRDEWFRVTVVRFGENTLANSFEVITERKRRELQLKQSNEALRRFAGIVSHDLQTPLRHISLFAELIEQALEHGRDPAEFIGQIKANAARMRGLIRSMLDYSMVAYSKIKAVDVPLAEILREARLLLQTDLDKRGVCIEIGQLPVVHGDKELLIRVFQNLFSNCLRHADTDELKITVSATIKDAIVTVRVADNGVGIPTHYADRIFEIGQQIATTKPVVDKGAGIGLSICKAVIESHGGQLWLVSEPGEGTSFYFTLPLKQERANPSL